MRTDWTISACCHLVVLGTALVSFTPSRLPATHVESIPVNIVTDTTTSQVPKGIQTALKETQKPFAERIGEQNTVDNPAAKISPREVTATTDAAPPAPPPEPKQAEKKKAEPKRDLIADAIKKDEGKKAEQKKVDAKIPTPPKRPPQQAQPKFDPRQVAALLDKKTPERKEATGAALSSAPALGAAQAKGNQLSQNELDALRARLAQLWNPPAGARNPQELVVAVRIRLKPDGTLAGPPTVTTSGQTPLFMASRDSAIRAVFRGQPFDMLRPETYEEWKDIEVTFDPRDMVRG